MTTTAQADMVDELYQATTTPRLVRVPTPRFLCLYGHGDPDTSPAYPTAVQALHIGTYAVEAPTIVGLHEFIRQP